MAEEVDFVVVGAGSAGCALAYRLAEDGKHSVRLLEAGGRDRNPWIHIPVGYYRTIFNEKLGWGYATEPEAELNGRSVPWPRGKVLGGSSSINGLVYIRGQREDFDHWRQLGNSGWSYGDVLPYFKRAEDQARGGDSYHGTGGPLGVSDLGATHPLLEAYIEAAEELGIPRNDDFNGRTQEGAGYFQLTNRNGLRCSAAKAYLKPARRRFPNLEVVTDALTERVLIANGRAVAVRYRQGGEVREIRARREIVLSAGAINSPQILQLSGIGPGEHLAALGIEIVHELPGVGRNLQDHFQVRSLYRCTRPVTLNDRVKSPLQRALMGLEWALFRRGPLTIGAGQGCIFARTREELATPDIQFHLILFSADRPGTALHDFSGFTASICQLRPESRGEIMLRTADPADKPRITANYISTESDRRCIIDGLWLARRLAETGAMRPWIAEEIEPGPAARDDAAMLAHARARGNTIFHPTSTCTMGPATDPRAVVDPSLRVHGIDGLRVADASIMPTVVSGNTNAACIMIGEKCADMILGRPPLRDELPLADAAD
jgi:choline dehydrogenase